MIARRLMAVIALVGLVACGGQPSEDGQTNAVSVTLTDESITLSRQTWPAGTVTFGVTNTGSRVHEFEIFAGTDDDIVIAQNVADTSEMRVIDELEDIVPGATFTLDVVLEVGNYVIISNYPGEVAAGMVTEMVITDG